jgi:hypothetical protein
MVEPFYTVCRALHVGGGWTAFAAGTVALIAEKGGRRHIVAGRCFGLSMAIGVTAGILLSIFRPDIQTTLLLQGIVTLVFLATGYLAPRIGEQARGGFGLDRVLTAIGFLASLGLIHQGWLNLTPEEPVQFGVVMGAFGLWVTGSHAWWRGPAQPSRWRIEHLTAFLAAYTVSWSFIISLYIRVLPDAARVLIPAVGGVAGIVWARRRFGEPTPGPGLARTRAA